MTEKTHIESLMEKWDPVLNHEGSPDFKDNYRKKVTAILLENQQSAMKEQQLNEAVPGVATANAANYDPVLIGLVRRAMPQLMAYDVCGVQPMTLPTGLVFAMKARYGAGVGGAEALFNEANTAAAGTGAQAGTSPVDPTTGLSPWDASPGFTTGAGAATAVAEGGIVSNTTYAEMGFTIEKHSVTAKSRALKAEYSTELAQDLKAVHGLDAEAELSNILSKEIIAEINREVVRTIYTISRPGADYGTTLAGTFDLDTDANGRWSVERFKGLLFQIERDANRIAQLTRRGKGNFIICSSDVASALAMAGMLDYAPAISANLNVDEASSTFAGVLNGRYKVYVDPYMANGSNNQFYNVGYKGSSPYDAGMFYCPYVPLQMMRAVDPQTFQPKIGFKTRYGLIGNPLAGVDADSNSNVALTAGTNAYYRMTRVTNLM